MSPCVVVICSLCVHSASATSAAFRISATSCVVIVFSLFRLCLCVLCVVVIVVAVVVVVVIVIVVVVVIVISSSAGGGGCSGSGNGNGCRSGGRFNILFLPVSSCFHPLTLLDPRNTPMRLRPALQGTTLCFKRKLQ